MDCTVRDLERAARYSDAEAFARLQRAVARAGGREYALNKLIKDPADELWRSIYIGLGGVWARLVDDEFLGRSLFVGLPAYEGKQENVIIGLNNLEEGNTDTVDNWLSRYAGRKDAVIVFPLKLETAVAVGMHSIRDVPFFAREVDAYRNSFRASVENVWPVYGKLTYEGRGTRANLDELSLGGQRVSREVDIPVLQGNYEVLASEQKEGAKEQSAVSEGVELCLESLTGYKNPAIVFQYLASRMSGLRREARIWTPDLNWRRQNPQRALVLGRDNVDGRFNIDCYVIIDSIRPARGCRRAKNFPQEM